MSGGHSSPYSQQGWTPGPGDYPFENGYYTSPTATPSPSPYKVEGFPPPIHPHPTMAMPMPMPFPHPHAHPHDYMRPHTRAGHGRSNSMAYGGTSRAPSASPRFRSTGEYGMRDGARTPATPGPGYMYDETSPFVKAAYYDTDVPSGTRRSSHHPPKASKSRRPSVSMPKESSHSHSRRASMSVPPQQDHHDRHTRERSTQPEPRHRSRRDSRAAEQLYEQPSPPRRSSTAHPDRERTSSRRESTSKRASTPGPTRSASTKPKTTKEKRPVTEEDRLKWKIPKGFVTKNWDPAEAPILLLGSVFDSNTVGKWIYDWTANVHGANSAFADMAGDLWLLLIQLYGTVARMENVVGRVRDPAKKEMIQEFLDAGDRLTESFQVLLRDCSTNMVSKNSSKGLVANAGENFVDNMWGRDEKLPEMEKFLQHVRTYCHRFDVNCDAIVRHPSR